MTSDTCAAGRADSQEPCCRPRGSLTASSPQPLSSLLPAQARRVLRFAQECCQAAALACFCQRRSLAAVLQLRTGKEKVVRSCLPVSSAENWQLLPMFTCWTSSPLAQTSVETSTRDLHDLHAKPPQSQKVLGYQGRCAGAA